VKLQLLEPGVRVEVTDGSPHLAPVTSGSGLVEVLMNDELGSTMTRLDAETMTGRGLVVVELTAVQWGCVTTATTKTVWADIGGRGDVPQSRPPQVIDAPADTDVVVVRLAAMPVRLVLTSAALVDDVIRETTIAQTALDPRLAALTAQLASWSSGLREPARAAARAAAEAHQRLIDVEFPAPAGAFERFRELLLVLEGVAEFCRNGELLSLAPSDEVLAFRRWYGEEVSRQVGGAAPRACPFPALAFDDPASTDAAFEHDRSTTQPIDLGSRSSTVQDATDRESLVLALADVARALDATMTSMCVLQDDGFTIRLYEGGTVAPELVADWVSFSIADDLPVSEVARTGRPLFLRTAAELHSRFPQLGGQPLSGSVARAILPLGATGALVLGFPTEHGFETEERAAITRLAGLAGRALANL
jgi:hypothetical protein